MDREAGCWKDIRMVLQGKEAMSRCGRLWKDRDLQNSIKVRMVEAMISPIALYGSESWTMKKKETSKIEA